MTLSDFLAWEDRQPIRHEFDGIRTIAMTGGTASHSRIERNLSLAVGGRLRGKTCEFFGSNLKIEVDGRIRYPDGFVVCSPVPAQAKVVTEPVVIFEVLSQSTSTVDLVQKNREYAATPSVRRYIVLAQDAIGGTMFERVGSAWVGSLLGAETIIGMPEIGIDVPMTEFYADVAFPPDETVTSEASP